MANDKPIPVINNNNEENVNLNSKESTYEETDQAITGVEEPKTTVNWMTQLQE